jgi:predicted metal-dependent HD superfamily phosphohydrolase
MRLWREIELAYQGKNRFYHNLDHVADLLAQAQVHREVIKDFDGLCFSIFYHDLVYSSLRKDNEHKSALIARQRLQELSVPDAVLEKCVRQIEATKSHQIPNQNNDPDLPYFLDFDLSILGSDWDRYSGYALAIRREYRIYPSWMCRKGRKKALLHFLERPRLFFTDEYYAKYEAKARENLKRELRIE